MAHLVITVGREHGSGGRYVGEQLAQRLGIACYHSELVTETALRSGFSERFVMENEEKKPESFLFSMAMAYSVAGTQPVTLRLFQEQQRVIHDLAQKGPCVIIGRSADAILKDHPCLLRVFVCAPLEDRIRRIVQTDGLSPADAERQIRKKDKQRRAYVAFCADTQWGTAKEYDLCLNTGTLGLEGAVDLLEAAARQKL